MTTSTITRRSLLRTAGALPLGVALAPAIIGKAHAAAMKMRISSSQQNDPEIRERPGLFRQPAQST